MKPRTMPVHCSRALALVVLMALLPSAHARAASQNLHPAMSCESLASVTLPNTTVTVAQTIAAGTFALPGAGVAAAPDPRFHNLPAFCRVAAKLKPSTDSDINIEV